MLQITEAGRQLIRAALGLSRYSRGGRPPVSLAGPTKPKKRGVTQAYRRKLIDQSASILRRGEPTVFGFEGFMRHGLRSGLCLRGWPWREADELSADIVASALKQIGAKRPTWKQAQPEWTQEGVILIERERCVNCGSPLPEGHTRYCSSRCRNSMKGKAYRRFLAEQMAAVYAP